MVRMGSGLVAQIEMGEGGTTGTARVVPTRAVRMQPQTRAAVFFLRLRRQLHLWTSYHHNER